MNRLIKGLMTLVVIGAMATPASAQTSLYPGVWYWFPFGDPGTSVTETFLIPGTSAMELHVVDCCIVGDRFVVSADGTSLGETSAVDPAKWGTQSGAAPGEGSWTNPDLSKGIFSVQGGQTISMVVTADSWGPGAASIRTVTPEPGTILLMATGLLGLGVAMRRRNDEDEV